MFRLHSKKTYGSLFIKVMQVYVQCLQPNFNTKNKALFISCSLLFVNAETLRS